MIVSWIYKKIYRVCLHGCSLTIISANKNTLYIVRSALTWNSSPMWTQNGPEKDFIIALFLIAILRFLLYKPEPELTNFTGKITKGSTFENDWTYEKVQYFSLPYPLWKNRWDKFLDKCPHSMRRGKIPDSLIAPFYTISHFWRHFL